MPPRRPQPCRGFLIGGRYELEELLGEGGGGRVWAAKDRLSKAPVAVKLLRSGRAGAPLRIRSEISILRLHGIPGVVRLLDEGASEDPPFMVMELVRGVPFPGKGRQRSWEAIAPTTLALVETLARLHAEGVVHLDIKPDNVLVADDGTPTLLDFGIALDRRLDHVSSERYLIGTIPYMAPERIRGGVATHSADLYSLGVLLFHALSGRLPHRAANTSALLDACLLDPAPPLLNVAPDVPRAIAGLVDLLLSRNPDDRPRSAVEVMSLLRGGPQQAASGPEIELDGGAAEAVLEALSQGRAVDLVGPRLTGRSRVLDRVRAVLERGGRRVVTIKPARRPEAMFAGVAQLVGSLEEYASLGVDALLAALSARVERLLAGGLVILADDVDRMDEGSVRLLERCRGAGAMVRVFCEEAFSVSPGTVVLSPAGEAQLMRWFAGPERLLHLRSRAAKELCRVTGGVQGWVIATLQSWIRAGIVRWEGGALIVSPDLLERLEARLPAPSPEAILCREEQAIPNDLVTVFSWLSVAWPNASIEVVAACLGRPIWQTELHLHELVKRGAALRRKDGTLEPAPAYAARKVFSDSERRTAHAKVTDQLPPGVNGRFFHLTAALGDDPSDAMILNLAQEAIAAARRIAVEGGDMRQGFTVLREALIHLRRPSRRASQARPRPLSKRRGAAEQRLLATWVDLALADGTTPVLGLVHYEVGRALPRSKAIKEMDALVQAAIAYSAGGDRAHVLVEHMAPLDDVDLERRRQGLRALAARRGASEIEDRVIEEVAAWGASMREDEVTEARLAFWLGWWHYRRGRYREAADCHAKAASLDPWLLGRISAEIACASALMEDFAFEEAWRHAEEARRRAKECGSPYIEARAEWVCRALEHRLDRAGTPDIELVEAAHHLTMRDIEAAIAYTEASIAYRRGERDIARRLASRARELWEFVHDPWTSILARSLELASGGMPSSEGEMAALAEAAVGCSLKGIGVQALSLLAEAAGGVPEAWTRVAPSLVRMIPVEHWKRRMDTLSVEEALDRLGCVKAPARGTST